MVVKMSSKKLKEIDCVYRMMNIWEYAAMACVTRIIRANMSISDNYNLTLVAATIIKGQITQK